MLHVIDRKLIRIALREKCRHLREYGPGPYIPIETCRGTNLCALPPRGVPTFTHGRLPR